MAWDGEAESLSLGRGQFARRTGLQGAKAKPCSWSSPALNHVLDMVHCSKLRLGWSRDLRGPHMTYPCSEAPVPPAPPGKRLAPAHSPFPPH